MDKRRDRRLRQWNKVRITSTSGYAPGDDTTFLEATTCDLSLGGTKICSPLPLPPGSVITGCIDFIISREPVFIEAEVRWLAKNKHENFWEIGLKFTHLTPKTISLLMRHLYSRTITAVPKKFLH